MEARQKAGFYGWRNVILLFISYAFLYATILYSFSVIFPAMIKAMGWARGDASIAQTIRTLLMGFLAPLVAYFINRRGTRFTILLGGSVMLVGCLLLGTVTDQLWLFILFWGLIVGFGNSCCQAIPYNTNMTYWFIKRRSLAISIVLTGGAVGGLLILPFITWVITKAGSWKSGWLAVAGVLFIGTVVILWLKDKPADYGQYPDGISPEETKAAEAAGSKKKARTYHTTETWTVKEAARTRSLWFLILTYTSFSVILSFAVAHGVLHITDIGYTRMQAAYAISLIPMIGGIGRIPLGYLADIIEPRIILIGIMIAISFSVWGLWKAPSLTVLCVATSLYGLGMGAGIVLVPTMIGNYYSPPAFAGINGFMFPIQIGLTAVVPLASGYLFDFQKSYDLVLIVFLVMCIASVIGLFFAKPPKKPAAVN